jgi:shikimate kinase
VEKTARDDMIHPMKSTRNIYLIGPQGAGKTTIGRKLAKMSHLVFFDSDLEIEKQTGVTISTIFEFEGEAGFRKREEEMIARLTQLDNIVLSCGGGTVLSTKNREALVKNGIVIYLRAKLDTQLHRTNQRKGVRPLLDIPDPYSKIIELEAERRPLYESIATQTYDTDKQSPVTITEHIIQHFLTE